MMPTFIYLVFASPIFTNNSEIMIITKTPPYRRKAFRKQFMSNNHYLFALAKSGCVISEFGLKIIMIRKVISKMKYLLFT